MCTKIKNVFIIKFIINNNYGNYRHLKSVVNKEATLGAI